MIAEAQRLNPEIHFHQGNMLALPDEDNSWGGIAAFYCIIHIPREQIVDAFREMKRVLKPGGVLLITFHIGQEIKHLDEWWEKPVNLDFAFYEPVEMETWLKEAGYELEETLVREPNPEVEVATQESVFVWEKANDLKFILQSMTENNVDLTEPRFNHHIPYDPLNRASTHKQ